MSSLHQSTLLKGDVRVRVCKWLQRLVERLGVALFAAALSKKCDEILAILRLRDQEIHVIARDKGIGVGKPFIQSRSVPHDV